MRKEIKAVSRDILYIAKRWRPKNVLRADNVGPTYCVFIVFQLKRRLNTLCTGSFPIHSVGAAV